MPVQENAYDRRRRLAIDDYSDEYTTSGSDGSRIVNGSNAEYISGVYRWFGGGSTSVSQGVIDYSYYSGTALIAAEEEYDPAFVARVLRVDAAPNEATFDNVVDLMDWLERD
jgi:hypothetical protein